MPHQARFVPSFEAFMSKSLLTRRESVYGHRRERKRCERERRNGYTRARGCTPASFIARALRALNASVIFVFAAIGFSIPRVVCIIEASKPKQFANV
jgi:hypothetical protein